MLAEEELRDRLLASAELAALVGNRIFGGRAAQSAVLPLLVWKRISGSEDHALDGPAGLVRGRFAIDCYADTYEATVVIGAAAAAALQQNSPSLELYLDARQDFYEDETPKRFRRSLDFTSLEVPFVPFEPAPEPPLPATGTGSASLAPPVLAATGQVGAALPVEGLALSGVARVGQSITVTNPTGGSCFVQATHGPVETYYQPWRDLDLFQPEPAFTLLEDWLGLKLRVRVPILDVNGIPTGDSYVSNEIGPILHAVDPESEPGAQTVSTPAAFAAAAADAGVSTIVLAAGTIWDGATFPNAISGKRITTPQDNPAIIRDSFVRPTNWQNVTYEGMVHHHSRAWLMASVVNRDFCFEPTGGCNNLLVIAGKAYADDITEAEAKAVPPTLLQSPYRKPATPPADPLLPYTVDGTDGMTFTIEGFNVSVVPNAEIRGFWGRNMDRVLVKQVNHQARNVRAHGIYFDGLLLQNGSSGAGRIDGLALSGWLSIYDEIDATANSLGSGNAPHTDGAQRQGAGTATGYVFDRYVMVPGRTRAWADGLPGGGNGVMPSLITSAPMVSPRFRRCLWNCSGSVATYMANRDYQLDYVTSIPFSSETTSAARFNGFTAGNPYLNEGRVSRSLLGGPITSTLTAPSFYLRTKRAWSNIRSELDTYVRGAIDYRPDDLADLAIVSRPQPGYEGDGSLTATGHWKPLGALPATPVIAALAGQPGGFDLQITEVVGATAYRIRYRPTSDPLGPWEVSPEDVASPLFEIRGLGSTGREYEVQAWVETDDGVSNWSAPSLVLTENAVVPPFPAAGDVANIATETYSSGATNALTWQIFTDVSVPAHSVLAVAVGRDGTAPTSVIGADTAWSQAASSGVSGVRGSVFFFHNASGSPVLKSLQVDFNGSEQGTAVAAIFAVEPGATVVGLGSGQGSGSASSAHNPPSFNAGAIRKTLWMGVAVGDGNVAYSAAPSGFTAAPSTASAAFQGLTVRQGAGSASASTAVAFAFVEARTLDPTAFTAGGAVSWAALTCAFAQID